MGNVVAIVMSYRLLKEHNEKKEEKNKEKYKKKNLSSYLYGKCIFKDVSISNTTNPLLREEKSRKNLQRSISR
tara:strand:+ start:121 stop:339 length:219 start_codon:yes stop_codon:yes gene_type:complete